MALGKELGPLAGLQGTWEGDQGLDVAFYNEKGKIGDTPYREKTTFKPFGPVENGRQVLYGLDYRTAAWRDEEENPFHTEVGYWLWDAADGQVMRCFMVPRGTVILAGGDGRAGRHDLAHDGEVRLGDLRHPLQPVPRRPGADERYEVTMTIGDGTFSYDETTTIEHGRLAELMLPHRPQHPRRVDSLEEHGEVSRHEDA